MTKITKKMKIDLQCAEIKRLQLGYDSLGDQFSDNGIVKTVLRERIEQETKKLKRIR